MWKRQKKTKKSLIQARRGYNSGRSIGISKLSVTEKTRSNALTSNLVDKRCGTALRDLTDAWRGHKLPDGKAIGGKKNSLTEVNIKKLQVNYGKAIRSNVVPDVKTAKDHKDAVDKMKKAVMASLYHSIMLKDDQVRHQFCPSGDTSWCKFRSLGNMENAPHH